MIVGAPPEHEWWLRPSALAAEILQRPHKPAVTVRYRLADALLEVDSDYERVLYLLQLHWDDCATSTPCTEGLVYVRSSIRMGDHSSLALVSFEGSREADGSLMPASRFQHLLSRRNSEAASPIAGWSLAHVRGSSRPFMTRSGHHALIDVSLEPLQPTPGLVHRYLLAAAVSAQSNRMFVHAAAVAINGACALLMGPAASGKTTVSFALAVRGHVLLSDEMSAIRPEQELVLPLRRTPGIRRGPRAKAVASRLEGRSWPTEVIQDGTERMLVRAGEIFPGTPAPAKLGCAFYLSGFAERASVRRIDPTTERERLMRRLCDDPIGVYGVTPGRRLVKLLALLDLLSNRPCYFLEIGAPEETAELIERTVQRGGGG